MKKLITAILPALLALAILISVPILADSYEFSDLDPNEWYYQDVTDACERGLMQGKGGGVFGPEDPLTRAEYITILWRMSGSEECRDNGFKDVRDNYWYAPYVGWAVKAGITNGYPDGTFGGENPISRQELMVMTVRYLKYAWLTLPDADDALDSFSDEDKIEDWAYNDVEAMRETGIIKGDDNGAFNPGDSATRAEIAAITVRLDKAIESLGKGYTVNGNDFSLYALYSDFLSNELMSDVSDTVKTATGVTLPITLESSDRALVIGVDESLRMLEYRVSVGGGKLKIDVSTEFAADYMPRIVKEVFTGREFFDLKDGFVHLGTYKLDEAPRSVTYFCETDKNPLSYGLGESVTFRISMLSEGKLVSVPYFSYMYHNDDGYKVEETVPGHSGQLVFTFKGSTVPGAGHIKLVPQNENKVDVYQMKTLDASVFFDYHNVKAAAPIPNDFKEFWNEKLEEICAVEPEELEFEVCPEYSREGYDTYDAKVKTNGKPVYLHITVPKNAESGSLKIYSYFQHHGRPRPENPRYNNDGISVCVNSHSVGNHFTDEEYLAENKAIGNYGFFETDREESYFLGMLQRDIQGIRYIEKKYADLWNGVDISTSGSSMGGFQAIAIAGIYDKITYVDAGVPWMCDLGGDTVGFRCEAWAPEYSDCNKYFDTAYFAEYVACPVYIRAGLGDMTCPPSGMLSMYNALKGEKAIIYRQCAGHSFESGEYNTPFTMSSASSEFEPWGEEIEDNGCAVTPPTYGYDRVLTAEELALKELVDKMTGDRDYIEIKYKDAYSVNIGNVRLGIKRTLDEYGLDSSYSISIDGDSMSNMLNVFLEDNDGKPTKYDSLFFTVKSQSGAYYKTTVGISLVK